MIEIPDQIDLMINDEKTGCTRLSQNDKEYHREKSLKVRGHVYSKEFHDFNS